MQFFGQNAFIKLVYDDLFYLFAQTWMKVVDNTINFDINIDVWYELIGWI